MTNKIKDKTLNAELRNLLKRFAFENVKSPKEQAAFDAAYAKAKPLVIDTVTAKYPAKDMKVLDKYGAAVHEKRVAYGGYYDNESTFYFLDKDAQSAPLVPRHVTHNHISYGWTKEVRAALDAYVLARQALNKALDEKKADYTRLIEGSRTFNEVVAVWPAAEQLRPKIVPATVEQRALAVLSEEAIARIKADNAGA